MLPEQLNIMRNMFGDVAQTDPKQTSTDGKKESTTYNRFAGKISANHAVEWLNDSQQTPTVASKGVCYAMPRTGTASEQAFALVDEIRTLGALDFMRPVLNEAA